jgi:hypothetical protein
MLLVTSKYDPVAQAPGTAQERALELLNAIFATSSWLPTAEARRLVWAIRTTLLLAVAVALSYAYDKTLWDWIQLLIVPGVIAGVGLWFNRQQQARELESTERRTQDEALQTYLDQMGQLLLDRDKQLLHPKEGEDARTLARAWTLTVLPRLDGLRKRSVVQFLYESGLITKDHVVIDLTGAHLATANLTSANLKGANLSGPTWPEPTWATPR